MHTPSCCIILLLQCFSGSRSNFVIRAWEKRLRSSKNNAPINVSIDIFGHAKADTQGLVMERNRGVALQSVCRCVIVI